MFEFFSSAIDFFNFMYDFVKDGLYQVLVSVVTVVLGLIGYVFYIVTDFMIGLSWDVAKNYIELLNISPTINNAWASVDSTVMSYLTFFKVPEAFNNVFSAYVTRFIMKFTVPWF